MRNASQVGAVASGQTAGIRDLISAHLSASGGDGSTSLLAGNSASQIKAAATSAAIASRKGSTSWRIRRACMALRLAEPVRKPDG